MSDFNENNVIKYCGNCGKNLIEKASFCAYCGFSIEIRKQKEPQTQRTADFNIPTNDQDYSITHQRPGVPYTPYIKERIQPRPFLTNLKGAVLTPKTDLPLIAAKPNLSQPLILNMIIGLLSSVAMVIMLSKMKITLSPTFFDSLTTDLDPSVFNINELEQILTTSVMIFAPIMVLAQWLIYSLILWLLISIFAPDIISSDRNFRKMATITGWAQIPMILQQITSILMSSFFLTDGRIEYLSITETVVTGGEIPLLLNLLQQGIQIFLLLWSVLLIYYGIKSVGTMKTNPATISMAYGMIVFIFSILLSFTLV
ncbi:MAG: YIP1 family protein [Candidatus Hodarchaeales archaeon]|jgi:hypothetical protein